MKKKDVFVGAGIIFVLTAVFLLILSSNLKTKQIIHPVQLDSSGKSPLVKRMKILQQSGARPRFSPDGKSIVFDRKNEGGFYNLYLSDLEGNIIKSLTERNTGINQRNNGNIDLLLNFSHRWHGEISFPQR